MKLKIWFCAVLVVAMLSGCAPEHYAEIAATTLPVYQFTSLLCEGTGLTVTRLVTENISCLHDYSLNVNQVRALEAAKYTVINGGGLEESMEGIFPDEHALIDSSRGISLIECHEHEHDDEHGHHHEEDAHIWLSPRNAMQMAHNICQGLCQAYPAHRGVFEQNLTALIEQLTALEEYGQTQLRDLSCRKLITFHDGFAYFADAFDLEIIHAMEEESGSEASAQELKKLIMLIEEHQLPAIFTERSGSVSAAGIISAEIGTRLFSLDMAMSGNDYFKAMYHNIDTIKEALG